MESGSEVKAKDFKFNVIYNYGQNLDPFYNFIVLQIDGDEIYISGNNFKDVEGLEYSTEPSTYYFVRDITELEKALL
jgi:hypothetical protein